MALTRLTNNAGFIGTNAERLAADVTTMAAGSWVLESDTGDRYILDGGGNWVDYPTFLRATGGTLTGTLYSQDVIPRTDDAYWLGSDTLGYKGLKWPDMKLYQVDANTIALRTIGGARGPLMDFPTGRTATIMIAASDATASEIAQADFFCDGVADEVQILLAIAALSPYGGRIQFSSGTFYISSAITLIKKGVRCSGSNSGERDAFGLDAIGTRFQTTAATPIFILGTTGDVLVNQTSFDHLFFDGNNVGTVALEFVNAIDTFLNHVVLRNFTVAEILGDPTAAGDYVAGIYADKVIATKVKFIPTITGRGVLWAVYFNQSWLNNVDVGDSTHVFAEQRNIRFSDTWHQIFNFYGLSSYLLSQLEINDMVVEGAQADTNLVYIKNVRNGRAVGISVYSSSAATGAAAAISIESCQDFPIIAPQASSLVTADVAALKVGLYLNGCQRVPVVGGTFKNLGLHGIKLSGSSGCSLTSNTLLNVGQGNDAGRVAILLEATSVRNNVIGNNLDDNATKKSLTGILESAAADDYNTIIGNTINGVATPMTINGVNSTVRSNKGYITENSGTATVANGATTVVVNHGLATTPTRVLVTATLWGNAAKAWVTTLTSTQFTINVDADPGAGTATFNWRAQVGEG